MTTNALNDRITARGREIYASIAGEKPSLFDRGTWIGTLMEWSMRSDSFRTELFRFVDVFPMLSTGASLADHIRDYFGSEEEIPPFLAAGAKVAGLLGGLGGVLLHRAIAANIGGMARQFIAGETIAEAVRTIERLRNDGFAAVVDLLGEATLTEEEAESYTTTCLELVAALAQAHKRWPALAGKGGDPALDWGDAPRINLSVKPSALACLVDPRDFEGAVARLLPRLRRIAAGVKEAGGFLCIDMESHRYKGITLELYRRLKAEHRDYPHLGVVLQAYLKETERDLEELLAWARGEGTTVSVRLVKGAYWDYETVLAAQNGWEIPVRAVKAETDAAFERLARRVLENHDVCHLACGSHNIRSIAAVLESARALNVPTERYEFQMLYGMAEPVRRGIGRIAGRVRLYCPYGSLLPGMGYLVRRLLENSSNESFLRRSFGADEARERLLEDPAVTAARAAHRATPAEKPGPGGFPPFANEPAADFTKAELRDAFPAAIAQARAGFGETIPLHIGGHDVTTDDRVPSVNPNRPSEVIAAVCQAGPAEVEHAVAAAAAAFPAWRDMEPVDRAAILLRAAAIARGRLLELAALQVLEIGKQWDQAYADVAEAIDFMEYYAREAVRIGTPRRLGDLPGEVNLQFYEPRGVAAVIAPWNFPLAISTGMTAAALATGNCVIYKPSGLTPVIGRQLLELFREAGLPAGVLSYLPGRGSVIGDLLVDHPRVATIAFTGSLETGARIMARAAVIGPAQTVVKRVICEMGGKNAVIVDDDADLDEAVPAVVASAFGFQGQKCSACSRVIVLDAVYDRFTARLLGHARALKVGPAEDPSFHLGAVADETQRRRILDYIAVGREVGELLYQGSVPEGEGYFVPVTIFGGVRPEHRIAREEIFGPVLAVMRARDFDEALSIANDSPFALTGGLFSRSPSRIERARREFRAGNLYINRGITGALVGRQPFGGFRLSGGGTKAGGPDYLLHFTDPRVVTENTMRRGFAPEEDGGR